MPRATSRKKWTSLSPRSRHRCALKVDSTQVRNSLCLTLVGPLVSAEQIAPYATRAETEPVESVKEGEVGKKCRQFGRIWWTDTLVFPRVVDFLKDKDFAISLHRLVQLQDEWIAKENDYRYPFPRILRHTRAAILRYLYP
jgi:hypothetical protein